jgi:putative nucleotidyltransferase with HDIG domain
VAFRWPAIFDVSASPPVARLAPKEVTDDTPTQPALQLDVQALISAIDSAMAGPSFEAIWQRITDDPQKALQTHEDETVRRMTRAILTHFERFRPEPAAFPAVASNIMTLLEDDTLDVAKLSTTLKQDPAVTAHVLRVANSVLYRRTRSVSDLGLAIVRIGLREVMQIASGVAAKSLFDEDIRAEFEMFRPLWEGQFRRSMTLAHSASWFSLLTGKSRPERAFLAGMLHDIGRTVALRTFCALVRDKTIAELPAPEQLNMALDRTHTHIGASVLRAFGLPAELVQVCEHHHDSAVDEGASNDDVHLVRILSGLLDLRVYDSAIVDVSHLKQSIKALRIDRETAHEAFEELGASAIHVGQIY